MKKRKISRSTIIFAACLLAVPTVPELMAGMEIWGNPILLKPYLAAGFLLGLAHLLLRPLLRMITLPLGCLTFGLSGAAIDAILPGAVDFPVVLKYVIWMVVLALLSSVISWVLSAMMKDALAR